MFRRMLIASELSPVALAMLKCLKGLRQIGARECLLVQCLHPQDASPKISNFLKSVLAESLKQQKAILTELGYEVETRVVYGLARQETNRIAVAEDFSLIVVGAAEQSLLGEAVFGGVAYEVIHHANRPVLLVRTADEPQATAACDITGHLLFPTDFSQNAEEAFAYVKKMVADGAKQVTLVHVQDQSRIKPEQLREANEADEKRLHQMRQALAKLGSAEVDLYLRYGSPAVEITKLVREHNISLVVMGSQGRGFVEELYLGSVSHNVARHAPASVLLIPTKRKQ